MFAQCGPNWSKTDLTATNRPKVSSGQKESRRKRERGEAKGRRKGKNRREMVSELSAPAGSELFLPTICL